MSEQGAPNCFAKQWDPKEPECAGGLDPAYTNSDKNSRNYATHTRDRCVWFGACGTKTQAMRMEKARDLISPQSLVRNSPTEAEKELAYWRAKTSDSPPTTTSSPPVLQPAMREFAYSMATAQQRVEMERYQKEAEEARRRGYAMPPSGWGPQQMQPWGVQQMMPVNYQMPQYLSAPEDMYEGRGFLEMLATTVFRSVMKSAGHSVAHVFDAVPLGRPRPAWRPPEGGGGGG